VHLRRDLDQSTGPSDVTVAQLLTRYYSLCSRRTSISNRNDARRFVALTEVSDGEDVEPAVLARVDLAIWSH
jgi:hypothetical protein